MYNAGNIFTHWGIFYAATFMVVRILLLMNVLECHNKLMLNLHENFHCVHLNFISWPLDCWNVLCIDLRLMIVFGM